MIIPHPAALTERLCLLSYVPGRVFWPLGPVWCWRPTWPLCRPSWGSPGPEGRGRPPGDVRASHWAIIINIKVSHWRRHFRVKFVVFRNNREPLVTIIRRKLFKQSRQSRWRLNYWFLPNFYHLNVVPRLESILSVGCCDVIQPRLAPLIERNTSLGLDKLDTKTRNETP